MWAYTAKIAEICNFCINLPKRGIPLKRFLQYFAWGRELQDCTLMPNFTTISFKMWPYCTKNGNFWLKKWQLVKNSGVDRKLEHRCTTTNLRLCNDTIIILKIILLYNVSVITNYVIPKRDKNTDRQKTSHFFVHSRRATQDLHHTWHGDTGSPSRFCTPQLFLIRSVVSQLGAIEYCGKMPPPRENAYNLSVCPSKVTKLKT